MAVMLRLWLRDSRAAAVLAALCVIGLRLLLLLLLLWPLPEGENSKKINRLIRAVGLQALLRFIYIQYGYIVIKIISEFV